MSPGSQLIPIYISESLVKHPCCYMAINHHEQIVTCYENIESGNAAVLQMLTPGAGPGSVTHRGHHFSLTDDSSVRLHQAGPGLSL